MFDTAVLVYKSTNEQVFIITSVMFQNFQVDYRFDIHLAVSGGYALTNVIVNLAREILHTKE